MRDLSDYESYIEDVDAATEADTPSAASVWGTLSRPLPKKLLQTREGPGGKALTYITWPVAWKIIKAKYPNAQYRVLATSEMGAGFAVTARITIDGLDGDGVGWAPYKTPTNVDRKTGEIKRDDRGNLMEDARVDCGIKDAESDALKRAARSHGLGIDLWIREELQAGFTAVLDRVRPAHSGAPPNGTQIGPATPFQGPAETPAQGGQTSEHARLVNACVKAERALADAQWDSWHVFQRRVASRMKHVGMQNLREGSFGKLNEYLKHLRAVADQMHASDAVVEIGPGETGPPDDEREDLVDLGDDTEAVDAQG